MKKHLHLLFILLSFSVFSACAGSKAAGTSSGDTKTGTSKAGTTKTVASGAKKVRSEDLSAYRPKVATAPAETAANTATITPTNHVNDKVEMLLDTLASNNKSIKYAQGYRILVYTGNDRKTALDLRKTVVNQLPDERDYLTYSQPTFKLKIGDYYSRMEANQALQQIKSIAPNASIVSDQVNVNRPR